MPAQRPPVLWRPEQAGGGGVEAARQPENGLIEILRRRRAMDGFHLAVKSAAPDEIDPRGRAPGPFVVATDQFAIGTDCQAVAGANSARDHFDRSEEHTSELQSP